MSISDLDSSLCFSFPVSPRCLALYYLLLNPVFKLRLPSYFLFFFFLSMVLISEVVSLAKSKVRPSKENAVAVAALAQEHGLDELLYPAYAFLLMRDRTIAEDEAELLEFKTAFKLSQAYTILHAKCDHGKKPCNAQDNRQLVISALSKCFGSDVDEHLNEHDEVFDGKAAKVVVKAGVETRWARCAPTKSPQMYARRQAVGS